MGGNIVQTQPELYGKMPNDGDEFGVILEL
jgi:hypothetical protein